MSTAGQLGSRQLVWLAPHCPLCVLHMLVLCVKCRTTTPPRAQCPERPQEARPTKALMPHTKGGYAQL